MNQLDGIKNIFFDLGGVLLNIDFSKTYEAFAELGIKDAHVLNERPEVLQLFMDFECGKYTQDELVKQLISFTDYQGSRADLISAFCALLRDYIPGHIELVQSLSSTYRIFLLSNTNAFHAAHFNAQLKREYGIENLDHIMEKAFYSHDLGYRKPDHRIFHKAIQLAGVVPKETLFIDDSEDNVIAARECGLVGVKVDGSYTILDMFS